MALARAFLRLLLWMLRELELELEDIELEILLSLFSGFGPFC